MLEQLRAATKSLHDEAEQLVGIEKMKDRSFSKADYIKYLLASYRFHLNIESAFQPFAAEIPYSAARIKTAALKQDLLHLKNTPGSFPQYLDDKSLSAAMGYLYVSEGSMLGAQVICKSLLANPEISQLGAFHFLTLYNKRTGVLWSSFIQALERQNMDEEQIIVNAAIEAFDLFLKIYDTPLAIKQQGNDLVN